ncbi:NAD-dependent epimerase/dehydratase family protein [Candidatus Uhrbacteria bacterium]|nr:NAD-dependent epimerase/dehydratase family protein [Candidatus Uhrbacteria bacterium]
MKCLVTGGAGFIGSHLTEELIRLGHSVVVVDNFSLGSADNLAAVASSLRLKVYQADINSDLTDIFSREGFAAVFHLAAIPRARYSVMQPRETNQSNVSGMFNVLESARMFGVKRFVFSSSASVYGETELMPLVEKTIPCPVSPYALEKSIGEQYCRLYAQLYGMETISLRYFNVYGQRQNPAGDYSCLIPKFMKLLTQGCQPEIYGDGEQTRDFVHVSDVVRANIIAGFKASRECFGDMFNIGTGTQYSVRDVYGIIREITKRYDIEARHCPPYIEPRASCADTAKSHLVLGWLPCVEFKEGLAQTYSTTYESHITV